MSVEELTPYVERLSFGGKAIATEIVECVLSRVAEWNATWRVELAMFDGVLSSEDPLGSNGLDRKFAPNSLSPQQKLSFAAPREWWCGLR